MAKSFYKSHLFLSVGPKKKEQGLLWSGLVWDGLFFLSCHWNRGYLLLYFYSG